MGKVYSSDELIDLLTADGCYWVGTTGSHHPYKHPTKTGRVTITHPRKEIPKGTANQILKQAALK